MAVRGLPVDWTKGVDDSEAMTSLVRNSTFVLSRLKDILEGYIDEVEREENSTKQYDNPSWAYKQAHNNGVRQGLNKALTLLTFMEK